MPRPDVVVVDHHDSYTWNLVHLLAGVTGVLPRVVQHDEVEPDDVLRHSHVVLSPGPGHPAVPADFAVGREVLRAATRPVLGVCLGMQGLVTTYGGTVDRQAPAHGEVARIRHDGRGVFAGLPADFAAVRYHSLAALVLPEDLEVTATVAGTATVMGVRHTSWPLEGVQFHPESILTEHGAALVRNFLGGGVSATEEFLAVAAAYPRCFWLDGGGARDWSGRRSILGWLEPGDVSLSYSAARGEVTRHVAGGAGVVGTGVVGAGVVGAEVVGAEVVGTDILSAVEAHSRPGDQWFGYLGYAARPDLPAHPDDLMPDAVWMRPSHVRLLEHPPTPEPARDGGPAGDPVVPAAYASAFAQVTEHLHAGNSYEVNLTHRLEQTSAVGPAAAYLRLRELNPAPYAGFLQHDVPGARGWLLSSSPERFALVREDGTIETKPIKGTTPRGATPEDDAAQAARLAADPKFRAENLMIVDLLRNDLSMVCEPGSVVVPTLMAVESYPSVHQLVSEVTGRLRADVTTWQALRALFPAGSMTGAPKLRTMEIIAEVETTPRGAYAGAFGWIAADGRADLGVVIRSLLSDGERWRLGTGGAITVASDVAEEYAEAQLKAARLRQALAD